MLTISGRRLTLGLVGALALSIPAAQAATKPAPRKPAATKPAARKPAATRKPAVKPAVKPVAANPATFTASWPMFRGNPRHTAFSPLTVNVATLSTTPAWKWTGKPETIILSSPAIAGGAVYFGTRDAGVDGSPRGSLISVGLADGKTRWQYNVSDKSRTILTHAAKVQNNPPTNPEALGWVYSSPSVVGGMVYVTSRDGALHALTTDGKLKWRLRTGGLDTSSPTVVDGTVYFGSGYPNKDFWAVNADTGWVKWRRSSGIEGDRNRPGQFIYSSQAFADNTVYGAAGDGGFYAIDAKTGKVKWRYETTGGVYFHSPTVAGDLLIGAPGDYDTNVYALNRTTGKVAWKYVSGLQQSYVSSPAYDGESVYIGLGTPNQQLVALDATNGTLKWKYQTGYSTSQSFTSSPAVTNNVIFVGTAQPKISDPESGRLVALDKATGKLLWEVTLPKPIVSSPAVVNNHVVVGCMDGSVYAFRWGA